MGIRDKLDSLRSPASLCWILRFPGVEREWSVKSIRKIFENHGYVVCDSYDLEEGYEKVVFYIDESGEPQHFARQLPTGKWTSKIGDLNDIEHDKLESLATSHYGEPRLVLEEEDSCAGGMNEHQAQEKR
jgi:hypothetical protein